MRKISAAALLLTSLLLIGCNDNELDKILAGQKPAGGYLITRQKMSNFDYDGVSQIGALYYVSGGQQLSQKKPQDIKLLCAVIKDYGNFGLTIQEFDGAKDTREYKPSVKTPEILSSFFKGISLKGDYSYKVTYAISNLKYTSKKESDLDSLLDKLNSSRNCRSEMTKMKNKHPNSAKTIFQLVAIASADIARKITQTTGLTADAGGIMLGNTTSREIEVDSKNSVFKVYKEVN